MPPGLDASGETLEHPHPRLGLGLGGDAKRGAARLIHRHAFRNQLVPPEQAMDALAGVGVLPEAGVVGAGLVIEQNDLGALADRLQVAERLGL